jgi:hypothetical protein
MTLPRRFPLSAGLLLAAVLGFNACRTNVVLIGEPIDGGDAAPDADTSWPDDGGGDHVGPGDEADPDGRPETEDAADVPECSPEPGTGSIPVPFSPENGTATGSLWAPSDTATLRPLFRWRWTPDGGDAPTFEIQVDDSCSTPGFAWCCFPSPEASASGLSDSRWRPDADLPVDRTPPVGRRYYWRVRACRAAGCSTWSDVRYADVGQVWGDWNGDGYSDLVVGAPGWAHAFVYFGGAAPDATADVTIVGGGDDMGLGESVAYAGDVNADGFADLLVGGSSAGGTGRVYLYLGSAAPDTVPDVSWTGEGSDAGLGAALGVGGDVNADGFADLVLGAPAGGAGTAGHGSAYLHLGGSRMDEAAELRFEEGGVEDRLGRAASMTDLNGDGFADVLLGAPGWDPTAGVVRSPGYIFAYFGSASPDSAYDHMFVGDDPEDGYGLALSTGDLNGDGWPDVLVRAAAEEAMYGDGPLGQVFLVAGAGILDDGPGAVVDAMAEDGLVAAVTLEGDLDGDGLADAVIGAPWTYSTEDPSAELRTSIGRAAVVKGTEVADVAADAVLSAGTPGGSFGYAFGARSDFNGDGRKDLLIGAPSIQVLAVGQAFLWFGGDASWPAATPSMVFSGTVPGDQFGAAVD